ncbi:PQQ-binding-like beta-propeller repeat protein [Marinobacter sp.]|uniref:outer membrane protein assembly factor BamB family protein n=1 Tax=Marinobacter sp. TaxID=50741 RepID=UPI0019FB5442|nr:PQQ-binding-like beta-propeller repeat protein [Marinobacter sp.]MBE0486038.1 PQQ-binding-like beta-propeller repeat protein [Marinobacter sp.]
MRTIAPKKTLILLLSLVLIAACTATIKPEWTGLYNHKANVESDRLTWLEDLSVNSHGDVMVAGTTIRTGVANRVQDILLVRYSDNGQRRWAVDFDLATGDYRSDDSALAMAIDGQDNVYILANQFKVFDDNTSSAGAWLISADANGNERWRYKLSDSNEMRALSLTNDKLYVTGPSTQVFNLEGAPLLHIEHPEHTAHSVTANANGHFVIASGQAVSLFSASGEQLWQQSGVSGEYPAGDVTFTMNGDIVATNLLADNGGARISRYTPAGDKLWTRTFSAAYKSYGLPGPALVFEDYRGDLLLTASNADGHRIVKLDGAGRTIWNKTSRNGIIKDAALKGSDLFVVGGGFNAKYESDGSRVAESKVDRNVQITTGSVAVNGNKLYAGYSAESNGSFALYLSQYLDR